MLHRGQIYSDGDGGLVVITDDFNRADGNVGGDWTLDKQTGGTGEAQIESNRVKGNSSNEGSYSQPFGSTANKVVIEWDGQADSGGTFQVGQGVLVSQSADSEEWDCSYVSTDHPQDGYMFEIRSENDDQTRVYCWANKEGVTRTLMNALVNESIVNEKAIVVTVDAEDAQKTVVSVLIGSTENGVDDTHEDRLNEFRRGGFCVHGGSGSRASYIDNIEITPSQ